MHRLPLAVGLCVGAVLLTACTGSDSPTGAPTPSSVPASSAPATPTTAPSDPEPTEWPSVRPAAAGFDAGVLGDLAAAAKADDSTCFLVSRNGEVAGDWNWGGVDPDEGREVFSVTKSITSALVGIAVGDGLVRLDDPVSDYVPSWRGTDSAGVTVANLLSNDSGRFWSQDSDYADLLKAPDRTAYAIGLDQQYQPGETWAYNNAAIQVLDAVLRQATGMPTFEFARTRLFEPLAMDDTEMTRTGTDSTNVFFGLHSTCADLARFGKLYLDGGAYAGQQILPRSWVKASLSSSTDLNSAYGYLWWLNRDGQLRTPYDVVNSAGQPVEPVSGRMVPGAPADMAAALGFGGQVVMIDPGSGVVAVRLGPGAPRSDSDFDFDQIARVVTEGLR